MELHGYDILPFGADEMGTVSITAERYAQLTRAEHDLKALKRLFLHQEKKYAGLSHEEVSLINRLYFKECEKCHKCNGKY